MIKIKNKLDIPEGVQVEIEENNVKITGKLGSLTRNFPHPDIKIVKKNNEIIFETPVYTKKQKMVVGTFKAHISCMIKGVSAGYFYKMKMCSGHFPMSVSLDKDKLIIKNFLGEKNPRHAKILSDVKVEIKGNDIFINGINKEDVGQTAANIESATRIVKRDRRRFQDGIYLTEKDSKPIK